MAFESLIRENFPDAGVSYVTDWPEECLQVRQGKADALLWEESSLPALYEEYPELIALPEPVGQLDYRWCTQKTPEGKALLGELNAFFSELRERGETEEIYRRWENTDTAPDHVESFPMSAAPKGELKAVTCLDWQPVVYQNGEKPCGYMIELFYRFCAWAGYTPVLEAVDIQGVQAGFNTGKYDLLVYGMVYREENAEVVDFTDPVMGEPVYPVVLKSRWTGAAQGADGPVGAERFFERLANSFEKNFIRESRWKMILSGLRVTVALSVLSVLFGTVLGAAICFMRLSRNVLCAAFAKIYIRCIQGMPIVLMLLILYYLVFGKTDASAFWICVLGFGMDFSAYAAEMYRSGVQAVPAGQLRAAKALGFPPAKAFLHVVLPQMVIHCLPVYVGQVISTVKLTSVAGYISVLDLTRVSDLIRARTYEAFFPLTFTAAAYFLVAWLLTLTLKYLEGKLDPMQRKRTIRGVREDAA